jgi:hypothetical protein
MVMGIVRIICSKISHASAFRSAHLTHLQDQIVADNRLPSCLVSLQQATKPDEIHIKNMKHFHSSLHILIHLIM